jgi:SAM-dependent methyltransferase
MGGSVQGTGATRDRSVEDTLEAHKRSQALYFQGPIRRTIVPRNSLQLERYLDKALQLASVCPTDRVLELGCGMGRFTLLLAERNVQVEGLDQSATLLNGLQTYNAGRFNIPLHCADALNPPRELDGTFDVILGFLVLHHLKDLSRSFAAVARLLKPAGRSVFLEPNAYNPLLYLQIPLTPGMSWEGDRGILQMRQGHVLRAMGQAGLSHLTCSRFGFFPSFIADRQWGSKLETILERVPIWRPLLPFQLFRGERP